MEEEHFEFYARDDRDDQDDGMLMAEACRSNTQLSPDPCLVRSIVRQLQHDAGNRRSTTGKATAGAGMHGEVPADELKGYAKEFTTWCQAPVGSTLNGVLIEGKDCDNMLPVARPDTVLLYFLTYLCKRRKLRSGRGGAALTDESLDVPAMLLAQRSALQVLQDGQRQWEVRSLKLILRRSEGRPRLEALKRLLRVSEGRPCLESLKRYLRCSDGRLRLEALKRDLSFSDGRPHLAFLAGSSYSEVS